tara:strand:+ start:1146 stop:1448 length:303 start_codon:yes stop_codon:yes gene_type:complete
VDTDVRPPRAGTPYGRDVENYLAELYDRTGGETDKVEGALVTADSAETKADTAQATADTAQATADAAQGDATLSLSEVASLAATNAALLKEINFLDGFIV